MCGLQFQPLRSEKISTQSVAATFLIRKCMNLRGGKWLKTGLEPIDASHLPNKPMKPIYHLKGIWMEFHPSYPYLTKISIHECTVQFPY